MKNRLKNLLVESVLDYMTNLKNTVGKQHLIPCLTLPSVASRSLASKKEEKKTDCVVINIEKFQQSKPKLKTNASTFLSGSDQRTIPWLGYFEMKMSQGHF